MSNYDVITIGSSLIDLFIESDEFSVKKTNQGEVLCEVLGDKIDVDKFTLLTGGGASNTAVGFSRQGFKTAAISEFGKDLLAEKIITELRQENVDTNYVIQEKREETGISVILVAGDGRRTVMVYRGASSLLEKTDVNWRIVEQGKWVHLSNISGQKDLIEKLFQTVAGKDDPGLSWNPGKADISLMTNYKISIPKDAVDILFVNEEEWEMLKPVQKALLSSIEQIVITNGEKGGRVYYDDDLFTKYAVEPKKTIEVTGAGDAFAVGYVSSHLRGGSIDQCLELAKKNSASVVKHVGAKEGLLDKSNKVNKS